jgi:hypothetical protein
VSSDRAPAPAWVRDGSEFYLPLWPLTILFLSCSTSWSFPLGFLFPSISSSYALQARGSVSVYIRPICINALFSCVLFARPGLVCVNPHHNLVCITMPLVCVNPHHDLVCITMPFCLCLPCWTLIQHDCQVCPLFLSSVWLPSDSLIQAPVIFQHPVINKLFAITVEGGLRK